MKATIENAPVFLNMPNNDYNMLSGFNSILQVIASSSNEVELRDNMKKHIGEFRYFKWGFGGSHMWVHQSKVPNSCQEIKEGRRLIYVEF